jgi:hypothetical protein
MGVRRRRESWRRRPAGRSSGVHRVPHDPPLPGAEPVHPVAPADRVGPPPVERLPGEAGHPAGHRDRDLVGGEVDRPAATSFCGARHAPGRPPPGAGSRSPARAASFPQLPQFGGGVLALRRGRSGGEAALAVGDPQPAGQAGLKRSRNSGRPGRSTGHPDRRPRSRRDGTPRGRGVGTTPIPPARTNPHRQAVNRTLGSPSRATVSRSQCGVDVRHRKRSFSPVIRDEAPGA